MTSSANRLEHLAELVMQGKLTRREFLKHAMLLGVSASVASSVLAACAPAPTPVPPTAAAKPTEAPKATVAPPAQLAKVRVGWAIAPHMALQAVALKKGWFKEAGLEVELTAFDSGAPLYEAMAANKIDISHTGSTPPIVNQAAASVPNYFIGSHGDATQIFYILARKNINSPADLKGKTGITAKGSVNHFFLGLMLDKYGLSEKDVTLIHMDYADHVNAFVGGQADFVSTGTAFWPQILTKSGDAKILFKGPDLAQPPGKLMKDRMFETTAVKKDFADANPAAVTKYVDVLFNRTHAYFNDAATKKQAHQELLDWLKANVNFNQSLEELSALLDQVIYYSAAEQLKFFQDGTFKASEESQIKYLVDTARIKTGFPFEGWGNPKFVEGAVKK